MATTDTVQFGKLGVGAAVGSFAIAKFSDVRSGSDLSGFTGYAGQFYTNWDSSANCDFHGAGIDAEVNTGGTHDFTNSSGLNAAYFAFTGYGTGTVALVNGLRIYCDAYLSTVTSLHLLHLNAIGTPANVANKYAIYQAGANDLNYFAGTVQAGGFIASDASPGINTTITAALLATKTITVKNGLITAFA